MDAKVSFVTSMTPWGYQLDFIKLILKGILYLTLNKAQMFSQFSPAVKRTIYQGFGTYCGLKVGYSLADDRLPNAPFQYLIPPTVIGGIVGLTTYPVSSCVGAGVILYNAYIDWAVKHKVNKE